MAFPSTKKAAEIIGSRLFETGKPCFRGHLCPRYTKGSACVDCVLLLKSGNPDSRQRSVVNAQLALDAAASSQTTYIPAKPCKHGHSLRFVASNNCVQCDKDQLNKHKIARKFSRIEKEYGLSKPQYLDLVAEQKSSCALCGVYEPDSFKLHIDHCDKGVRGLLCQMCNQGIGLLKHNPTLLRLAADYCEVAA